MKVQVGKDQEKAQSEKDSHSKNRGGKKPYWWDMSIFTRTVNFLFNLIRDGRVNAILVQTWVAL